MSKREHPPCTIGHRFTAMALAAIMVLPVAYAHADLILKSRMQSSGLGGLGAFKLESETRQNANSRDDRNRTHFTGALLKWVSGKKGMESRGIIRLDKEVIWDIRPKEKEYTELTFAEQRRLLQQGVNSMQGEGMPSGQSGGSRIQSAGEPTVEVVTTGKTFKVSGYEGKGMLATVTMPYFDSTQNRLDTLVIRYDAYLCNDGELTREMNAFNKAYAEKLKFDMSNLRGLEMLFRYLEKPMTKMGEKLGKEGIPLKFTLTLMKPKGPSDGASGAGEGEKEGNAQVSADSDEKKDAEESMQIPTSTGEAAGQAMKSAFGFFKKKKEKEKEKEKNNVSQDKQAGAVEKGIPSDWVEISNNEFEYSDIQITSVGAAEFDLPTGLKKVEHPATKQWK